MAEEINNLKIIPHVGGFFSVVNSNLVAAVTTYPSYEDIHHSFEPAQMKPFKGPPEIFYSVTAIELIVMLDSLGYRSTYTRNHEAPNTQDVA